VIPQFALSGKLEQFLIVRAAPEEIRKPRR
jgi:hypothetical protein